MSGFSDTYSPITTKEELEAASRLLQPLPTWLLRLLRLFIILPAALILGSLVLLGCLRKDLGFKPIAIAHVGLLVLWVLQLVVKYKFRVPAYQKRRLEAAKVLAMDRSAAGELQPITEDALVRKLEEVAERLRYTAHSPRDEKMANDFTRQANELKRGHNKIIVLPLTDAARSIMSTFIGLAATLFLTLVKVQHLQPLTALAPLALPVVQWIVGVCADLLQLAIERHS